VGDFLPGWAPVLMVLAVLSMVVGNLAAIVQTNVKRLLAYSAIAHAGYALLAIAGRSAARALRAALLHDHVCVHRVGRLRRGGRGGGQRTAGLAGDFAGLSRRAPVMSFCMLVFMLSLAGIPPLSGFFGKFYVFTAAAGRAAAN
jgi:NADH-quinone oxidoreductase subunit N